MTRQRSISMMLLGFIVVAGLVAAPHALAAEAWRKERTALFQVEVPSDWKPTGARWDAKARVGQWQWEGAGRDHRLQIVVKPAPRVALAAHVDAELREQLLERIAKWKVVKREQVDVDGRTVVLVFGHGLMRRNRTVRPHGVLFAAYLAQRGLVATVLVEASHERMDGLEALVERVLDSTRWNDDVAKAAPAKAAPVKHAPAKPAR